MKSISKELFEIIADVGGLTKKQKEAIKLEDKLSDYGFDWIDEFEIVLTLEQKLKLFVNDSDVENVKTVGDIVELFKTKRKNKKDEVFKLEVED